MWFERINPITLPLKNLRTKNFKDEVYDNKIVDKVCKICYLEVIIEKCASNPHILIRIYKIIKGVMNDYNRRTS